MSWELIDRVQGRIGTKKPQAMRFSQGLGTSELAGAEGLEPSARGFGVDVGEHTREWGRASVARFPKTSNKRAVLIWCCGEILQSKIRKKGWNSVPLPLKIYGRVNKERTKFS